jgi:hypothetical protein
VLATIPAEKLEHHFDILEGEGHIPVQSFYQGLRQLFATWIPEPVFYQTGTLREMKDHYAKLSRQHGFPVSAAPDIVQSVGGRLLRGSAGQAAVGQIDRARAATEEALRLEPDNPAARRLREELSATK